jgi:hypothetical protein
MNLPFDPSDPNFKNALGTIPGYPPNDKVAIRTIVFESNAVAHLGREPHARVRPTSGRLACSFSRAHHLTNIQGGISHE